MLPPIKKTRSKDQPDLGSLMQSQFDVKYGITQLQKALMQKAEQRNTASIGMFTQSFQELRNQCSNIAGLIEKLVKLQTYTIKAQKHTLSEIKEMNKGLRDSDKEVFRRRNQSVPTSEIRETSRAEERRFNIQGQFQVIIAPAVSQIEKIKIDQQKIPEVKEVQTTQLKREEKVDASQNRIAEGKQEKHLQLAMVNKLYGESREEDIVIPVKSCQKDEMVDQFDSIKGTISTWVGKTYDILIKQSFNGYFKKEMQQSEAKVFFSQNLMLNFLELLDYLQKKHQGIWNEKKDELMQIYKKKAQQTLTYYLVKYPQKKMKFIDPSIKKSIKAYDNSASPEFHTMINVNCDMRYTPEGDYSSAIKKFLNALISESSKHFIDFKQTMKSIFTLQKQSGQKYELDNLIGTKLRQGTPLYTDEEIKSRGIQIKTPEILRVIMKWVEELQEIIDNPDKHFGSDSPFTSRVRTRVTYGLTQEQLYFISECLKHIKPKFEQWQSQYKKFITLVCKQLSSYCQTVAGQFKNISSSQMKKTLPAYAVSEVFAATAVTNLNYLIKTINEAIKLAQETAKGKGDIMKLDDLEFIKFSVSDLLRCKCSGTVSEVIEVMKRLQKHDQLTIVRIKDRLKTGNQDFLVNVKMKNCGVLCEIQVGFKSDADQKMVFLDHFNHFLYELARSEYGPLAESTLIASNLTLFNGFYQKLIKNLQVKDSLKNNLIVTSKNINQIQVQGYVPRNHDFSFICTNCLMLRKAYSSFFKVFQRKDEFACGQCAFELLSPKDKSTYFLGPEVGSFFQYQPRNQRFNLSKYKVLIPLEQNKSVRILTDFHLYSIYTHILYQFNPYFYQKDVEVFDKAITMKIKPGSLTTLIDTNQFMSNLNEDNAICILPFMKREARKQRSHSEYLSQFRKVIFAQQKITLQKLQDSTKLHCVTHPDLPYHLIIDVTNPKLNLKANAQKWSSNKVIEKVTKSSNMTWDLGSMHSIQEKMLQNIEVKHALKRLKLSQNNITSLNLFICDTLQQLYLNWNKITKIQNFGHFPSLQILEISQNQITDLQNIETFTKLRILKAQVNSIRHLDFSKIPSSLQILSLRKNQIEKVQGQFSSPHFHSLNLEQNKISQIPFENLCIPSINQLYLQNNNLKKIILPQKNFSSLTLLQASYNPSLIEIDISQLGSLQRIQAQYCKLKHFTFLSKSIVTIKLSNNYLQQIKFTHPSPNLEEINVEYNMIKQLDLTPLGPLESLLELNIDTNEISTIRFTPPKTNYKLTQVRLLDNPWPIKFSSSIKRSEAPKLQQFSIGKKPYEYAWSQWFLRTLDSQKLPQFIAFCQNQLQTITPKTRITEKAIKQIYSGENRRMMESSWSQDCFTKIVKKYFGVERGEATMRDLVKESEGEYYAEATI